MEQKNLYRLDGRLLAGGAVAANAWAGGDDLIIGNTTSGTRSGITLVSGSNTDGGLYWSDGNSGTTLFQGQLVYNHSNSRMQFYTFKSARVTIDDVGRLLIGRTTALASSAERLTIDSGMVLCLEETATMQQHYTSETKILQRIQDNHTLFLQMVLEIEVVLVFSMMNLLWIFGQNGIAFRTSGSAPSQNERMRIDSAGNVTLGYDGTSLHFQNGFNNSTARIQNGGGSNNSELKIPGKKCRN